MNSASRKISKRRESGTSSISPSNSSKNGGIRQYFSMAKTKRNSASDSRADVDRIQIEQGNDMSIRDLQDLHIDLDRGLCRLGLVLQHFMELVLTKKFDGLFPAFIVSTLPFGGLPDKTFLRKLVEKDLHSRPTAELIEIVIGLIKGNELVAKLRGESGQETGDAVFDEKIDEAKLNQLIYEIRADAVECLQVLMDSRPPICFMGGKIVLNRLYWCPGESNDGDASGIMNLLDWFKLSSSEISMLIEDPSYDPRRGKVLPMSRLVCMAIRAMVDDLNIRIADFDEYGEAAVLKNSRLFKTLYDSSVTRHLRKSLFDQVLGIAISSRKPLNWRADALRLLEAWYVLENSLPNEGDTILKCKEEFFKGRLFDLVKNTPERKCYLNSTCMAMRRDYLCGYVLKAFDSCFPRHLQQYKNRLEDKDLGAILELAAEEQDDGKAKKISPLLSIVRDEDTVIDLVFHALCTAIDAGLGYCTKAKVKAKALKAMQAICTDDEDEQSYLAISTTLLEGI